MLRKKVFYIALGLLLFLAGITIFLGRGLFPWIFLRTKFSFDPPSGNLAPLPMPNLTDARCTLPAIPHFVDLYGGVPPVYRTRTFTYSTNSRGFREKEFHNHKTPGTFRIIVLGTGVTFGNGVSDQETYPHLLEEMLNKGVKGKEFEVLNLGIPASCTDEGVSLLKEVIAQTTFDFVIFCYGINDALPMFHRSPEMYRNSLEKLRKLKRKHNLPVLFLIEPINNFFPWRDEYPDYLEIYKEIITGDETNEVLDLPSMLDEVEREGGLRLKQEEDIQRLVRYKAGRPRILKEVHYPRGKGKPSVSPQIYDYLDTHRVNLATFIDDVHLNETGHRLVAERIYEYLISKGIAK